MQITPGNRSKVTLGNCASMGSKRKHSHKTDRQDKLENIIPEPEIQIPLPIVGFLLARLNEIAFAGRNRVLQSKLCICLLMLHCFRQIVILSLLLVIS